MSVLNSLRENWVDLYIFLCAIDIVSGCSILLNAHKIYSTLSLCCVVLQVMCTENVKEKTELLYALINGRKLSDLPKINQVMICFFFFGA